MVDLSSRPTGVWFLHDTIYVASIDGLIFGLDPEDGREVHRIEGAATFESAVSAGGIVVTADETGRVAAFLTGGDAPLTAPVLRQIDRPGPSDTEEVVREFYDAMTKGDLERVADLIAVDASFAAGGNPWFSPTARNEFWSRVDFFRALNLNLVVGACEQQPDRDATIVNCEVTQTDDFLGSLGVEITGHARLTVEDGLIHVFRSRPRTQQTESLASGRRGLDFAPEADLHYGGFIDWAVGIDANSPCRSDLQGEPTIQCAAYMIAHVEEYLAASH
jgi:hypothetical protein